MKTDIKHPWLYFSKNGYVKIKLIQKKRKKKTTEKVK